MNSATDRAAADGGYPRISVVTPSFNQGEYLEQAIRSVLDQNYPDLEYLVIDGGSTDGSVDIIRRYAERLAYWCSEPDGGQYAAINKGFTRSTGRIMAWLNADDMYFPQALQTVAAVFTRFPEVAWATSLYPAIWNKAGAVVGVNKRRGFPRLFFNKGYYATPRHYFRHHIQQESTFWTRSLWEAAGGLNTAYKLAADFDLWARFFALAPLAGIRAMLGGFRLHGDQRSVNRQEEYFDEVEHSFRRTGGRYCRGLDLWFRRSRLAACWPFNVLPSLGIVQPVASIRWDRQAQQWVSVTEYVD